MSTRNTSVVCSPSPVASESSDVYYNDPAFLDATSPTAMPVATADDVYNTDAYDTDTPVSVDDRDITPTSQPIRSTPSPASVIEISHDEFPALATPAPATMAATRGKVGKKNKGKKRAIQENADEDDPFLVADTAAAIADSLSLSNTASLVTGGASSSRCVPGSPPKRLRTNSAGNAVPVLAQGNSHAGGSPFLTPMGDANAATVAPTTAAPAHAPAPATATTTPAATAPVAAPAPAANAPFVAMPAPAVAAPIAAPVTYAAAALAPAALPNLAPALATVVQHIIAANAFAAPAERLWPTADGNLPCGSYTSMPAGGFPLLVYSYHALTQGMSPSLMQMYREVPDPKFLLSVSGGNGVVMQTHGLIRDSISNFINIDAPDFQLGTPPTSEHGTSSTLWLVAGIPENLTATILHHPVLASGRITV
ncbi:hypothetical protein K438DRAFT_1960797 [Mycena galopus ATCC 62051]|nr:hypothetical protein K438DRAFT_1960797 [Mycena galopus ATCC 62051]